MSQGHCASERNPTLPSATLEGEGTHPQQHQRSVRAGLEAIRQRRPLRKIDGTLPASYTRELYGNLPKNRAYLLTNYADNSWLSTYAKTFGFRSNDHCVSGTQETVTQSPMC